MSDHNKTIDFFKKALSAINVVEQPITYQDYINSRQTTTEAVDKSALEAWYNKYNKYMGNNGDKLADGFFEAYLDTGILTDATETNEFAKAVDDVFGGDTIKAEEELFGNEDLRKKHLPITHAMHEEFEKIMGAPVGATSPEDMEDNVSKAAKILGVEGMNMEDSEYDRDMEAEPTDHPDHEVNMAKSDMFKAMEYARDIYKMLERVSEQEGIEGWVAAKITKASDYLSSVKHYIEHEVAQADMSGESIEEKAVSKSQQQAAGAALAAKRGDAPKSKLQGASKEMMKMSTKELEKFAGTKHKGLPKKKESIGESTMTDTNKEKLNEGIRIQTDSLEDSIALMTIMKNAGLDPQQMNIQQSPSMNAPAPDMTPDLPAEIPGEEPKDMPMDEPESEAFDNAPDEKFLDKDDYELKRNKVPNSKMGSASAKQGDNPLEAIEEIAKQLNNEYNLFKEGRVKDMMLDMEADAADMSKEEFIKAHGEKYAYIWDRVHDEMMEGKKSKPDYLDFDKDGDKKEPMKKALADKKKK